MGYPDYKSRAGPSYGVAAQAVRAAGAAAVGTVNIANVTGKGIVYGGFILASNTVTNTTRQGDRVQVLEDGTTIFNESLQNLALRGIGHPGPAPAYMILYGEEFFNYRIGITPGWTFDTSFAVRYVVGGSALDVLYGHVQYATT